MPNTPGASADDLARWADAIAQLHHGTSADPGDERAADRAVANLWSGFGFQQGPVPVADLVLKSIEVGYLAALRDVREGEFDADIPMWRPDLG
ncbi:hypothetical protein L3Q65_00615 (plasmid) [Amycolatopsis sp. FU40]|uniref:hypothetical protein n=1 Tax=Amycolatopsis sp. FU40 TaxID=2914159 RepID=UPI001F24C0D3|nr:hypothetical protein [Amycolatopsis sp. FU40]UKD50831.1 hypothetical protein L3Q65_00615 [Amycolatopsis sp. FU40]